MQSISYGRKVVLGDVNFWSWVTPDCPVAGVCDTVVWSVRMAVVAFLFSRDRRCHFNISSLFCAYHSLSLCLLNSLGSA